MNNYIVLEISTWCGMSFGAEHYYGTLKGYIKGEMVHRDIEKTLTVKEANYLSKKDDWKYKVGNKTNRFTSKDEIRKIALKEWKKLFPNGSVLLEGSVSSAEPMKVLWTKRTAYTKKLNQIYEENENIPHVPKNYDKIDLLCEKFNALLKRASK